MSDVKLAPLVTEVVSGAGFTWDILYMPVSVDVALCDVACWLAVSEGLIMHRIARSATAFARRSALSHQPNCARVLNYTSQKDARWPASCLLLTRPV
jgi:hypothetical protein